MDKIIADIKRILEEQDASITVEEFIEPGPAGNGVTPEAADDLPENPGHAVC